MSEGFFAALVVIAVLFVAVLLMGAAHEEGRRTMMREAFERGHAVQCLGRVGYHWECDE